jgi:hypothetical protein
MTKIEFNLDMSDVFAEFELLKSQRDRLLRTVLDAATNEFLKNWRAEASKNLKSTRRNYLTGIRVMSSGRFQNSVVLMGKFNNMLEMGFSSFDMKKGFEKSSKAKISANGNWYLTIPFRWATPGAIGENSAFSGVMPQDIYNIVSKYKPTTTSYGKKVSSGMGLKDIPAQHAEAKSRAAVGGFGEYVHKSSIYEGITKSEKTYENATQSGYTSFRRVSKNSDKLAFIHKGVQAYDFASKAFRMTDFDTVTNNVTDKFLSEL